MKATSSPWLKWARRSAGVSKVQSVAVRTSEVIWCCLLLLGALPVLAQQSTVVAPGILATSDTPFGAGTLGATGYRIQEVYGWQHFPTQAMIITELRYRPDATYGRAFSTTVANIQFNLSTTRRNPE